MCVFSALWICTISLDERTHPSTTELVRLDFAKMQSFPFTHIYAEYSILCPVSLQPPTLSTVELTMFSWPLCYFSTSALPSHALSSCPAGLTTSTASVFRCCSQHLTHNIWWWTLITHGVFSTNHRVNIIEMWSQVQLLRLRVYTITKTGLICTCGVTSSSRLITPTCANTIKVKRSTSIQNISASVTDVCPQIKWHHRNNHEAQFVSFSHFLSVLDLQV